MNEKFTDTLNDFSQYLKQFGKKFSLARQGKGTDYTQDRYLGLVKNIVQRLHPDRMQVKVTEVIKETGTTKTLRFERTDGNFPPFRAGQYVNLYVEINGVRTSRPYSISSSSDDKFMDLTVRKQTDGFVSPYLVDSVKAGDPFETSGPAGSFYYERLIDGRDLVFIAGGSGITPFMGMLRWFYSKGAGPRITLIYGSRTAKDVIFDKELKLIAKQLPNLDYHLVVSEPPKGYKGRKGFIDAALIEEAAGDVDGKKFMICGPNAMYDFCLEQLKKLEVPEFKIKRELYGPPDNITKVPGWPGKIKATKTFKVEVEGKTIDALAGEPLINTLEKHGIVIPALCRSGECSACRMKVDQGRVFMPPHTGIRESDTAHGYIHACVAYPIENLKVRL